MTHLVPNPFDPQTSGPPLSVPMDKWSPKIWSPSNLVFLDKWSQKIWSTWTNGLQPIWSPYLQIIIACPSGQTEYSMDHLSRGDQIGWGPFVHGDRIFGDHLFMRTELVGDCLSWGTKTNKFGTNCGGPNVRGPYVFWDQICHSRSYQIPDILGYPQNISENAMYF